MAQMIKTKGSYRVKLNWLNVEFLLLPSGRAYELFIDANDLHEEDFVNDMFTSNGNCSTLSKNGETFFIMGIFKPSYRVVYHEALHITHAIFDHKGIPTDSYNSELLAYTQGWVAEQIVKRVRIPV